MNQLMRLQNQFQDHLLNASKSIHKAIAKTNDLSVDTRLFIYRDAYTARLSEALANNYPHLKAYLGDEAFGHMCLAYIDAHPSNTRSIRWFGNKLPRFLTHFYDKEHYYLAELASFEWHMTLAFDAADAPVVQVEDMLTIPPDAWPDLKLVIHPSVQRVNFKWSVASLWEALANDYILPSAIEEPNEQAWVLWRYQYINRYYNLSEDECWAMDAMITGADFASLCAGLCEWHNEDAVGLRAASLMKNWIHSGLISDVLY